MNYIQRTLPSGRIIVGISGIPASGKSIFAQHLVDHLNRHFSAADQNETIGKIRRAVLVGLDGWHYTRAQLDLFPEPKLAHDRRGSHWTFDSTAYVDFVCRLREETGNDTILSAPSFDHALKDPTPDLVLVHPYHRIVVIEGLYVFLAIDPWRKAGMMLDERCLLEVNPNEARTRLVTRHVITGVAKDLAEANWRADENDIPSEYGRWFLNASFICYHQMAISYSEIYSSQRESYGAKMIIFLPRVQLNE